MAMRKEARGHRQAIEESFLELLPLMLLLEGLVVQLPCCLYEVSLPTHNVDAEMKLTIPKNIFELVSRGVREMESEPAGQLSET